MNKTILILHQPVPEDAGPDEWDVLDQVEAVEAELKKLGYKTRSMPFDLTRKDFSTRIKKLHPLCVFNLVECVHGDGRLIHLACSYLDLMGIPYTGAGSDAMYLTSNKILAKRWMRYAGIPTPEWVVPGKPLECDLPFPSTYILKAMWEDASIGLDGESVVEASGLEDLLGMLRQKEQNLKKPCFAEHYIDGREFNLALLASDGKGPGAQVLPPSEITFDYADHMPRIVDYKAKWIEGTPEYEGTERVLDFPPEDAPLLERLDELALKCWQCFDLKGYARVDVRVDDQKNPWVLEINANPCISPNGGFWAASLKAGVPFNDMIARIVKDSFSP
ncbi:MAG TPA: D-alanine--D-alanine ligase [Deltaproteobacteria bacterium]|nr:D-alanine--D-alanine ligase [Deltaproteobacteria bacterium]HRW80513.1 D-alanine--D-alanine ligase [Desulfomonilia bacterium]NMD39481.1 D-alanine--D-alanine ligase [Deltaproteobacteria bacterium]HNQ86521.1 D-alanine--D-alanine ligase [Deltaproteobacteria bacterium]HNS90641.1 D-alanine--D-alanine ligase [Deltaproteobacteria bacterium]